MPLHCYLERALPHAADRHLWIEAWYVDHIRFPRSSAGRRICLPPDARQWEADLRLLWADRILPDVELFIALVQPQPSNGDIDDVVHVLLVQQELPGAATILITAERLYDAGEPPQHSAVAVPAVLDHWLIVLSAGFLRQCPPLQPLGLCRSWCRHQEITIGRPYAVRTGFGCKLRSFPSTMLPNSLAFAHDLFRRGRGGLQDLQVALTSAIVDHHETSCSSSMPHKSVQSGTVGQIIPFADVIRAFEDHIDCHFLLPQYDLTAASVSPDSWGWLSHWWEPVLGGQELWVYCDGSFVLDKQTDCYSWQSTIRQESRMVLDAF